MSTGIAEGLLLPTVHTNCTMRLTCYLWALKLEELVMRELSIGETRAQLARLLNQAFYYGARTIITKRGRPIAALISIQDLNRY